MNALSMDLIEKLKAELSGRRLELLAEVDNRLADAKTERVAPDAIASTDGGDKALLEAASGLDLAIVRRDLDELRAVDRALSRMSEGTFGVCEACGNVIAPGRLQAYPVAVRCAACQTEFEHRPPGAGAPR